MAAKAEWIWMPHAAHLIVGQDCRFHLATYVGEFIVSTVGEYWPDRQVREIHARIHDPEWFDLNRHRKGDDFDHAYMRKFGYEEIGCDRTYETMVFRARAGDAKHPCCPFVITSGDNVDFDGYSGAGEAMAGHLALCEKWAGEADAAG